MRQLAKCHGDELPPAGEASTVALAIMFLDQLRKLPSGDDLEKLTKNAAYSDQGGFLSVGLRSCQEPQSNVTGLPPRRIPNLDDCGLGPASRVRAAKRCAASVFAVRERRATLRAPGAQAGRPTPPTLLGR